MVGEKTDHWFIKTFLVFIPVMKLLDTFDPFPLMCLIL